MRTIFVCGPESGGNRFMVRLLCDAGFHGAGQIDQPIDGPPPHYPLAKPATLPRMLAFYRSFPHGRSWPKTPEIVTALRSWGYRHITAAVMVRDQYAAELSQVRAGHVRDRRQARRHIALAYQQIFTGLVHMEIPFLVIPYERLGAPQYRQWLTESLRLPRVPTIEWTDENEKYYGPA
jgi:hypothetical protein